MLRINNIKITKDITKEQLINEVIKEFKIDDLKELNIVKKSVDARRKSDVHYVYTVDVKVENEEKYISKQIIKVNLEEIKIEKVDKSIDVTIVGAGPAGLFAALYLIRSGIKPIIIEQGDDVETRKEKVNEFMKSGKLDTLSNIQFGEGGAGTFSDGKLTTGISSKFIKLVLEEFVNFGAPEEILYLQKPHLGTDNLIDIVKNIRNFIVSSGGEFRFNEKVIDFKIENEKLTHVVTTKDTIKTNNVILAIGHSARDTFYKIHDLGIKMEPKNFAIGVRIEHLQKWINQSQYGNITKLKLPVAEYKLAYHNEKRSSYTFCMCPGGVVVPSSSDKNMLVTNGMSYYKRDTDNANSALLVNIIKEDFYKDSPLDGIKFQQKIEEEAFILGGSNYHAPVQRVEDFLNNRKSKKIGIVTPSYTPGYKLANLNEILPNYVSSTLKEAIKYFGNKIYNFNHKDAILTGVETRSSSPVRINRDETLQSNILGVYPCGEGAGYAGGITSSAVDGIKVAIALINNN